MDVHDLSPFLDRYALIHLEIDLLNSCVIFIFDLLPAKMNSPDLLSMVNVNTLQYHTWGGDNAAREFIEVAGLFDFIIYLGVNFLGVVILFAVLILLLVAWATTFSFHRFVFGSSCLT
jgi:hypothetical protein